MKYFLLLLSLSCVRVVKPDEEHVAIQFLAPKAPACLTTCGVRYPNLQSDECAQIKAREDEFLKVYRFYTEPANSEVPDGLVCSLLNGWTVVLMKAQPNVGAFYIGDDVKTKVGRFARGVAMCDTKTIFLGQDPGTKGTALPHELAHVIDCSLFTPAKPGGLIGHPGWQERKICDALKDLASDPGCNDGQFYE